MRSQRKKKKVRLNLSKFIPFLIVVIAVIGLVVVGAKTLLEHPIIIGGTGELATKPAIEPKPKEPTYETINILCGGDVMAHMDQVETAKREDGTYDFSDQFTFVSEYFKAADLSLVNIETTFSGDGKYSGYPGFDSPDELAKNAVSSVDFIWLDENDHDCGFILMKGGTVRDTLEIGNCNTESTATIMGNYLNYNGNLYNIVDGKIQSHRPKYKVSNKDGNIIFEDAKGNQVIYGGEP